MAPRSDNKDWQFDTQLVHAGDREPRPTGRPVSMPIYNTATYTYDSMEEVDEVFAGGRDGYVYTRYGNPTVGALEQAAATLEGGAGACAYGSGMAALHAALIACEIGPGATVLASEDLYGATTQLLYTIFGSLGVDTVTANFNDPAALREKARAARPRVMIAETISNPLLKVCDLEMCAELAREVGARFIVDNTFASPYLCRPIEAGADFSVHSATKYLSGHADAMGGLVIARDAADVPTLVGTMKLVGGVLSVWEAHHISRGIKTLALRLAKQCENARLVAEHLRRHENVLRVYHPSLAEDRQTVNRVLRRGEPHVGALVSVASRDDSRAGAFRFMNALRLIVRSTSLGDVFTSALHPATASHRDLTPKRRAQLGITDGLVRLSIGIEDAGDIIRDLDQALAAEG